jgi:AsmA protein
VALVALRQVDAAARRDAPVHLTANVAVNDLPLTMVAESGPIDALIAAAGSQPQPVNVKASAAGATLTIAGTVAQPAEARGYTLKLDGTVPDLAALRPLAPKANLPPLHDAVFSAKAADAGGLPQVSGVSLRVGASDLSSVVAGLRVDQLDVSLPAADQPMHVNGRGRWGEVAVNGDGVFGAPSSLWSGPQSGPFPVDVNLHAAGGTLAVKGAIADPLRGRGLDLNLSAQVDDLANLASATKQPLPALKNIAAQGQLIAANGLGGDLALKEMKLSSALGDVAGEVELKRPRSVHGRVNSQRLDLDALRAAWRIPAAPAPAAAAADPTGPVPAPAPATPVPAAPATPAPVSARHVIPDDKLPFAVLRSGNADVEFSVGTLITGGETWSAVAGHLTVQNGKLQLAPFKANLPAGSLELVAAADANPTPPVLALKLQAPSLALQQILALAGQPGIAKGAVNLRADVSGAGDSPHAIAGTLNGTVVATMSGGVIDNRVLEAMLGPAVARANPVGLLERGGTSSEIRCLAARLTAHNGVATLNPFLLSSTLITVDGSGTVNLGGETLDLRLHPQGRVGGTGVSVPLTVSGGFANPRVTMNEAAGVKSGVEVIIGALAARNGVSLPGAGAGAPSCAAALAEARGDAAPPAPAPASPAPVPVPKPPNAGAVLRQLLR